MELSLCKRGTQITACLPSQKWWRMRFYNYTYVLIFPKDIFNQRSSYLYTGNTRICNGRAFPGHQEQCLSAIPCLFGLRNILPSSGLLPPGTLRGFQFETRTRLRHSRWMHQSPTDLHWETSSARYMKLSWICSKSLWSHKFGLFYLILLIKPNLWESFLTF